MFLLSLNLSSLLRNTQRLLLVLELVFVALLTSLAVDVNVVHARPTNVTVSLGVDELVRSDFKLLRGKRVGLVTNHTGISASGERTADLVFKAPDVKLVALFTPEHGLSGTAESSVDHSTDTATGLPVYSLFTTGFRPPPGSLKGIEVLVFDIQDIGARFYTYISTLGITMEEAAKQNIDYVVLDRPNPIGGEIVTGPIADKDRLGFTAYHPLPIRHGMTVGELATLFKAERTPDVRLHVIKMSGWKRSMNFADTGLIWRNTSPNMRSLEAAFLYPGVCLLEPTNVSVGRGTDRPFQIIGAPWIDGSKLATSLNALQLPGVSFMAVEFVPSKSVFEGETVQGVQIVITDLSKLGSIDLGVNLISVLHRLYPKEFEVDKIIVLLANKKSTDAIVLGRPVSLVRDEWQGGLKEFLARRKNVLLY